jgi:hypothetical protein
MSKNKESTKRVEFRWRQHEQVFAERLAESSTEANASASDHARDLLKNALTESDEVRHALEQIQREVAQLRGDLRDLTVLKEGLKALHENIYSLRDDLATSVVKLLCDAGETSDEEAQAWVTEAFDAE